ncbi:MAG: TrbC/VirB2 family protein [Desulfurococcales archaeon]|nr:TrbC/VirB2 family protein [Desulfurococcales archaeon]
MKARTWIATLALVVLQLAAPLATAQVNLTVTPQAPPAVESTLGKALGLVVLLVAAAGIAAILWGGFKMATGQEGGGRWLVGGVVALVLAFSVNEIVAWLTTP